MFAIYLVKIQQKSKIKRQLSLDLGFLKPIITNAHNNFPIEYIKILNSHSKTKCQKKEIGNSHHTHNLYQPLKDHQGIWSKTGIKNTLSSLLGQ